MQLKCPKCRSGLVRMHNTGRLEYYCMSCSLEGTYPEMTSKAGLLRRLFGAYKPAYPRSAGSKFKGKEGKNVQKSSDSLFDIV